MRVTKHHKSLYARFLSFSLSVVLCLTLFAGTAWTQNGAHEWGYERNSGSAERMREAIRKPLPLPWRPKASPIASCRPSPCPRSRVTGSSISKTG